jgi:hypothetical protein
MSERIVTSLGYVLSLLGGLTGCVATKTPSDGIDSVVPGNDRTPAITVDLAALRATVPEDAYGMHTSVYDNALHEEDLPARLAESGVTLLRYPGGGYSDNYHWSTHHMTHWFDDLDNRGYLAPRSDFGSYVSVLERTRTHAMITVNYGSNLTDDGPGEPKEAAAWVAYANGALADETVIGVDSTGHDWSTVGHWANLRAAAPLATDDGYNFLRIEHPEPLEIHYWEVGNEVFGNGYFEGGNGFEEDLHVAYEGADPKARQGHTLLSPRTYGKGVFAYAEAMKAVDPSIAIGAVLGTVPLDVPWGVEWNRDVLAMCGKIVDFVVVHYYPGSYIDSFDPTSSAHRQSLENLMKFPASDVHRIFAALQADFDTYAGDRADDIAITVTELGPKNSARELQSDIAIGIFALESYLTFLEYGAKNLDWLELHNGSFLSERAGTPGPAFNGIRFAHELAKPGDTFTTTLSNTSGLTAHAVKRTDGSVGLMLVNTTHESFEDVRVTVAGETLPKEGTQRRYARLANVSVGDGTLGEPTKVTELGNEFTIALPPSSSTLLELSIEATSRN